MHELNFDTDEQLQHPVIQKYKKLLQRVSDERVFTVTYEGNATFGLMECCDACFGYDLTKEDCLELAELFKELAEACGE